MGIHRKVIVELGLDEVTIGPPVFLPARIERVIPDGASTSTGGPVDVEKILRDARAVSSAARTVVEYFRAVEEEVRRERYDLENYPELALAQVYRMLALVDAGAEEARQDLELRRRYLVGELRDPTMKSVISLGGGNQPAGRPVDNQSMDSG